MTTEYKDLRRQELIEQLQMKDRLLEAFSRERDDEETLKFAWAGNLGHWYWDVQANQVTFNPLKATNLGYKKSEIPVPCDYQFFTDKLHPEDFEAVMQNMRDHLQGKTGVYEVEYRIQAKTGEWKWYYDRGKVTKRDSQGKPLFLAGIVFDISERKAMQEIQQVLIRSLSEQMRLQENLFSILLHDLRTPLSNMISFSELLVEVINENDDPRSAVEFAATILKTANQAFELTSNVMGWARAKSILKENKEPVFLSKLVFEVFHEFEVALADKNIEVNNEIAADVNVMSNRPVLKIALRNFISNALKYSHPGKTIRVTYEDETVSVVDKGVGMTAQQLDSLFSSSAGSTRGTNNEEGNGIGLVLVRELLGQINVRLSVRSALGEGTTVTLQFGGENEIKSDHIVEM
ncbi:PAS domain-containing sensor histidine kinase [uncultured Sunxiuqinia sp.]|uniref:sensor histidine kinase n=1 Tax=uncultured Sunxiuqinia sp. TaxID=1573825 RepID=UPI0030D8EC45